MAFCDFCPCSDCLNGQKYLAHAETSDGRWICDVCFTYDLCVNGQRKAGGPVTGSCDEEEECDHRPKLVGGWQCAV